MDSNSVTTVFVVGEQAISDQSVLHCLKNYDCEVITSLDGKELELANTKHIVVVSDFEDEVFKRLWASTHSIIGSPALLYNHRQEISLSVIPRPVHNFLMKDLVICMTGFHDREEADHLLRLLRFMGAASRKNVKSNVTHLVARKAAGGKYRFAVNTGVCVMSEQWIKACWDRRLDLNFTSTDPSVISEYKLKPFTGLGLVFINCDDTKEMEDLTIKNGGTVVNLGHEKCTHIVIDAIPGEEHPVDLDSKYVTEDVYVVYKEWFWASLEMAARVDEGSSEHAYPISGSKNFKRSSSDFRLATSSSGDLLSPALDFSRSLNSSLIDGSIRAKSETSATPKLQNYTKRHAVCVELFETERNYVEVLHTITKSIEEHQYKFIDFADRNEFSVSIRTIVVFKEPLENPSYSDSLLDGTEVKIIFGNIAPIYEVHIKILHDVQQLIDNWKETASIGSIFVKHYSALLKAYPPFVNYFEKSKEMIFECDTKYPRFHAFLKKCQSKPECKRQSLTELLIRPIQRLPSVILLLNDIWKNTEKSIGDYKQLAAAIDRIREVLMHINEDKRKTEGQIAMFDIINDIEECPPVILSANRHFVSKIDVKLLIKNEHCRVIPYKGYTLTLFLFNDVLEICKKRSLKRTHSLTTKGNNKNNVPHSVGSTSKNPCKKSYRHMESLNLDTVKNIFSFSDCEGYDNAFLLVATATTCNSRTFFSYPFISDDKDVALQDFLKKLITQVSQNGSLEENLNQKGDMNRLNAVDFEHAEGLVNGLTKSNFSFGRTRERISRAFSMKRPPLSGAISSTSLYTPPHSTEHRSSPSPSPRRIGRTLSQFLTQMSSNSPLQRRQMSTTSLTELPDENAENTFSLPTTPAPRKKKCQNGDTTNEHLGDI